MYSKVEDYDLPLLYWILKLHKCPYKQRFIAGSTKCSTKPLLKLFNFNSFNYQNDTAIYFFNRLTHSYRRKKDRKIAQAFYFTFRYIDEILIYQNELEIKDTTDTHKSASSRIRQWRKALHKTLRQTWWLQLSIVNFLFIGSNIPAAPGYGVYISELIQFQEHVSNKAIF